MRNNFHSPEMGIVTKSTKDIHALLEWFGFLCCRATDSVKSKTYPGYYEVSTRPSIKSLRLSKIVAHFESLEGLSYRLEGGNRPNFSIRCTEYGLLLTWRGSWTAGRECSLALYDRGDGRVGHVALYWKTGTGKRSGFIAPESRVKSPETFFIIDVASESEAA